ncbi:hypothetical protein [Primorskyibacter marinus]|nr:hypothetical protein [Primorskyibacter marinus]
MKLAVEAAELLYLAGFPTHMHLQGAAESTPYAAQAALNHELRSMLT